MLMEKGLQKINFNGMRLSHIGLGTASFKTNTNIPILIEKAIRNLGINWIDTSDFYGTMNLLSDIGLGLRYFSRSKYYILSKISIEDCKDGYDFIYRKIKQQCDRMGCGYLDMLALDTFVWFNKTSEGVFYGSLLHFDMYDVSNILYKLKKSGLVKNIGFVYIGRWCDNLGTILKMFDWDFVELRNTPIDMIKGNDLLQKLNEYKDNNPNFNIILMGLFDHGIFHNIRIGDKTSEEIILNENIDLGYPLVLGASSLDQLQQLLNIYTNHTTKSARKENTPPINILYEEAKRLSEFTCDGCLNCALGYSNNMISPYMLIQRYNKYKYSNNIDRLKEALLQIDLKPDSFCEMNSFDKCVSNINFHKLLLELIKIKNSYCN